MKSPIPRADDIDNELFVVCDALRTLTARVEALLNREQPANPRWLSTSQAVEIARIVTTSQSIRNWAKKFELGILVRGRWMIDRQLLLEFLKDRNP
jgi:hypothetical protein